VVDASHSAYVRSSIFVPTRFMSTDSADRYSEVDLPLLSGGAVVDACKLRFTNSPPWSLHFASSMIGDGLLEGVDLFECLKTFRRSLEERDLRIGCNGARVDTWATAMSRQMGGGRKVYVLTMGKQQSLEDLVDTFAEGPIDKIASVDEQNQYFKQWLESIGFDPSRGPSRRA
jgi:hypothetical protein